METEHFSHIVNNEQYIAVYYVQEQVHREKEKSV